jgi:hypothetical protein
MSVTGHTPQEDSFLGLRLLMTACVVGVTYFSWAVLWVVGSAGLALASLFSPTRLVTSSERFGAVWQWVVAILAVGLICTLLVAPRYSRLAGIAWFLGIGVLAVNGTLMPGRFDPSFSPLIPVVTAAVVLVGVHRIAQRAA